MDVPGKTQKQKQKQNQKRVVMCGRPGVGISMLTRDMVMDAVRCCSDCTQIGWTRECCDRCSEQILITNKGLREGLIFETPRKGLF